METINLEDAINDYCDFYAGDDPEQILRMIKQDAERILRQIQTNPSGVLAQIAKAK